MRSQPGSQTIVIHILLNISRSKGKFQTLKFALLVETFFLKNQVQNVIEKLVPDPFLKNYN